jgi:SAM-dependent methyltransferase
VERGVRPPGGRDGLRRQLREVPAFRALLRAVEADLVAKAGWPEGPALDLGCGDGHFARQIAAGPLAVGIDPDPGALRAAAGRAAHRALAAASATALPFRAASFGTVIANSVLEHVRDLDASLAEVARVLRPGGRLLLTVPGRRFGDLLLGTTVLRRLGLAALAHRYAGWFNARARHFHLEDAGWWIAALDRHGLAVDEWRYYFPPPALRVFDLLHYLGVPALLSHRLTGRWLAWRSPLTLALAVRWLAPLCRADAVADGACLFVAARRDRSG